MRRNILFLYLLIPAVIALTAAAPVFAQSNRGSISGTIYDTSGAVIPGAQVTATETHTNTTYRTIAGAQGTYNFPQVMVGTYNVDASQKGFTTEKKTEIQVLINTTSTVDFRLAAGSVAQTVTVSANAPSLETSTSDVGSVITSQQVEALPLSLGGVGAFRSPEAFAFLLPGVVGPGTANNANGIYVQKTSGGENFGDDVLLDGTSAERPDNGSTFDETAPSVDALQEFKVETATPPAQYGRTTGGVRSFTTRSGTNDFHGDAYDILRNTVLDANTWFNDLYRATQAPPGSPDYSTYATPKDIKNDYGVSLGGPVRIPHVYNGRNRTFFFFTWEQVAWPRSAVSTTTLPTMAMRSGDFSSILTTNPIGTNPCTGATVYAGQIFDPQSQPDPNTICRTTAFSGNQITSGRFDPVAKAVLKYLPAPTSPGLVNNYAQNSSFPTYNTTDTIRVDENVSDHDHLFASYSARENTLLTGGTPILPNPIDPNTWNQDFTTHYARVGWDHSFSEAILNHLNLGMNRTNSKNISPAVGSTDWGSMLGLGNISGQPFPRFNIGSGFASIGLNRGDDDIGNEADLSDSLTLMLGRHSLTVGGEYRWIQYNNLAFDNTSGVFDYSNAQTAAGPGVLSSEGGYSFASFMLGQTNDASLTVFPHYPRYTSHYYALFVQDDFRVNRKLTLNLGLRWSVEQPRKEAQNFTSNFDPNLPNPGAGGRLGALEFASDCNGCNPRWIDTWYKDAGPRIGFAFTPFADGRIVFRGGYGILYGPLYYADFANSMSAGYSASPNPVTLNGFDSAFLLSDGFPAYQAAPILDPTIRNNTSVDYIAPNFNRPPMIQSWSLQMQQQLAPDLIFSLAYVGNKGQNLRSASGFGQYNDIRLSSLALGQNVLGASINSAAAQQAGISVPYIGFNSTVGDALRPYPQYRRFNTDCCLENDGMSTFNAMEVMLQRRFRQGFNLQISYTWSKALDDADSLQPGTNAGGGLYQNPFDQHQEKAISSQDLPNMAVISGFWDLPVGKGRHFLTHDGWLDEAIGGWRLGGILRYQSGQPLPFYCATGVAGWDNCFRFDLVTGASVYNPARHQAHFNPLTTPYLNNAAFADPNPDPNAPIRFGTLPRVTGYRMDPYNEEDVNLAKDFHLVESATFQLRCDAFNLFNRHVFAEPYNLNPNPNAGANNTFGYVNSTADSPRVLQMEFRATF